MSADDAPPIRWRSKDDSSSWQVLAASPHSNGGFAERRHCVFEKPGHGWHMFVDDEPLADDGDAPGCWGWTPGFFAGQVTAELVSPPGASLLFLLDVAPDASKLGEDVFRGMIDEIWDEDPELVLGSEPAAIKIGELGATQDPWLEFARLRRYAPEFIRALAVIQAKPRLALRMRRDSAPLHRVRRVDRQTALSAARGPAAALFSTGTSLPARRPASDIRLDVPSVEESVDAAANRAMLALVQAVQRRVSSLRRRLQQMVLAERASETRTALAERWPRRLRVIDGVAQRLESAIRRWPFCDVSRAEITAAGLNAVSADPVYARAWGRGWRALRHGVESGSREERLWITPSWEVYERWCFVRLLGELRRQNPSWGWRRSAGGRSWVGEQDGRRASLTLQPTFASKASGTGRWSVSRERVPDLMFSVESSDGTRFVIMDAKYRQSREAVLDAMTSAHVYQDSLRIGARRPEVSLLLVPRGGGAPWLEEQDCHNAHRVGVQVFSPATSVALPGAISALLG